ncbi:hypothetical protein AALO_G00277790 [Alosa alosa]|uniref:Adrenomedullin n=1 Tax=Alosa alosa TaxID=278164 RepID=A0AAV6FJT1_9TELE|nr:hypothetical protein AALO_G00277790 [Alosa alosa]
MTFLSLIFSKRIEGLMKQQKDCHRCLPFMTGSSVVKMAVLFLLTAHLTTAIPLRDMHRTQLDVLHKRSIQKLKDLLLHRTENHASVESVIDNRDTGPGDSTHINLRVRRAPPRGCQLGTCQVHNLADTLYRIGHTNGKDESKKANDPKGYGR